MKDTQTIIKTLFLVTLFIFSQPTIAQEDIRFPEGAGVIDVTKPPYNAAGDGITDDTDAINRAFRDHPDGQFIIYLPNGTYLVSDRIEWPRVSDTDFNCTTEQSCRYTSLQGQSKNGTIIKLKDNAPGYQDKQNRKAVTWAGLGVAQRFRNSIRNLTINVGSGNPGAVATQFKASNQGGIFDVHFTSDDGGGRYGIDFAYSNEIGPLLVKNVEIDGFDIAVITNFNVNSITFENITIRDQKDFGFLIQQQVVTIRKLKSFNDVTAIRTNNQGSHTILIDSELNGTGNASNVPAIFYGANLFARNVETSGYKNAITYNLNGTTPINRFEGPYIDEFTSETPVRLCDNINKSLNLPIQETPVIPLDDPSEWANIEDFGARTDKNFGDDTAAIQAALNSGASTIYVPVSSFRNGRYTMNDNVTVPSTVKRIIGTEGDISGPGKFELIGGTSPIIIERFNNFASGIIHTANRALIIKSSILRGGSYTSISGADLFLEDIVISDITFSNQNVWARQFNTEATNLGVNVTNDNANLWILGLKTELRGTKIKTINGGRTEVLGGHMYTIGSDNSEAPMFVVENGSLSLAGIRETSFDNNPYQNVVQETRGSVTKTLLNGEAPDGINGSGFSLFIGYSEGSNTPPEVCVGEDITLVLPNNTITLDAFVNDDGLPNKTCFTNLNWEQISGPDTAIIENGDTTTPTLTFENSGIYSFSLSADDGETSNSDEIKIYVFDQDITTAEGNGADVAVYNGGSTNTNNYGVTTNLFIRNSNGVFNRKTYLRFDISSLQKNVKAVQLAFEISTTNTPLIDNWTYNVFGLVELNTYGDGKLTENWLEGTKDAEVSSGGEINWSNAPGNSNSGGGIYDAETNTGGGVNNLQTVFLGNLISKKGKREILRLNSEQLTEFIKRDTNGIITLIITRVNASGNTISFSSKENGTFSPPTLNIAVESVMEEPSIQDYTPPTTVIPGESYTVNIPHKGTGPADIQISLQNRDENWSTEGYAKTSITSSGIATLNITVKPDAALGNNYHWQAYITPIGGNWSNRYDNKLIDNISCTINKKLDIFQGSDQTISFYPNPANDALILRVDSLLKEIRSIKIYDLQGRVAKEISKDGLKENTKKSIDVSGITDGLYILSIDFIKKETHKSQLIIKH
ncbi:glycosyl hydrolase family 28-related protein [uncultured Aquimarina sp.]|uniref:glycosyl hydrolase family 28-related protein n=1 Tax=uncultured Aquimarina sp. TaxID=575652 RepID=UPI002634A7C7|nr:glycosyl hydrolase family 28-related protein [uncultured Aquimarina sp.]